MLATAPLTGSEAPDLLPLWTALAGALVAAVLSWAGAWIGAFFQSRREHERWVRERRYEAYVQVQAFLWRLMGVAEDLRELEVNLGEAKSQANMPAVQEHLKQLDALKARTLTLVNEFGQGVSPLAILGPKPIADMAADLTRAAHQGSKELGAALDQFEEHARAALRIKF